MARLASRRTLTVGQNRVKGLLNSLNDERNIGIVSNRKLLPMLEGIVGNGVYGQFSLK